MDSMSFYLSIVKTHLNAIYGYLHSTENKLSHLSIQKKRLFQIFKI